MALVDGLEDGLPQSLLSLSGNEESTERIPALRAISNDERRDESVVHHAERMCPGYHVEQRPQHVVAIRSGLDGSSEQRTDVAMTEVAGPAGQPHRICVVLEGESRRSAHRLHLTRQRQLPPAIDAEGTPIPPHLIGQPSGELPRGCEQIAPARGNGFEHRPSLARRQLEPLRQITPVVIGRARRSHQEPLGGGAETCRQPFEASCQLILPLGDLCRGEPGGCLLLRERHQPPASGTSRTNIMDESSVTATGSSSDSTCAPSTNTK